jgi:hypothetical protein
MAWQPASLSIVKVVIVFACSFKLQAGRNFYISNLIAGHRQLCVENRVGFSFLEAQVGSIENVPANRP